MKYLVYIPKTGKRLIQVVVDGILTKFVAVDKKTLTDYQEAAKKLNIDAKIPVLNGKIIGSLDFGIVRPIMKLQKADTLYCYSAKDVNLTVQSCLDYNELDKYIKAKPKEAKGWALEIDGVTEFITPFGLESLVPYCEHCEEEFKRCKYRHACPFKTYEGYCTIFSNGIITRPPQNMQYCYYKGKKYGLISIKAEWAEKIFNRIKTIEVRTSILNELKEHIIK